MYIYGRTRTESRKMHRRVKVKLIYTRPRWFDELAVLVDNVDEHPLAHHKTELSRRVHSKQIDNCIKSICC